MKLSQLIAYLNLLNTNEFDPNYDDITIRLKHIVHTVQYHDIQFASQTDKINLRMENIHKFLNEFDHELKQLKSYLREKIAELEPSYYEQSLRWFKEESCFESSEYIWNRQLPIDPNDRELLCNRLKNHGDWRLPGLIIHPSKEKFIELMVPLDPLYLVDRKMELLTPAINLFPEGYQKRLRPYVIDDKTNGNILDQLPDAQFGLIFAYHYFNFVPMEVLKRYLTEMSIKLRPGGTLIFTYNECEHEHGVGSVENRFMCYTTGRQIKIAATIAGLELVSNHYGYQGVFWFEFKKPGNITSRRGAQTLAKIIHKND